ncbi:hypothetical protein [Microcystis phage Mwe-JY13]
MTLRSKRGLVLGDSISSLVYTDDLTTPDASRLWVSQVQSETGIHLQNLSAPGNRISVGGSPDASIRYNSNAFNLMRGVALPSFVIITAGTNDYAGGDISAFTNPTWNFHTDYRWILNYWKANGVPVLVVAPLWRSDEATAYPHPDGAWPLSIWRSWICTFAAEQNFPFMVHTEFGLTPDDFVQDTPALKLHMKASGHDKVSQKMAEKLSLLGWI